MANKTEITNNINTRLADNTNGDISAEDMRIITQQLLDNTLNTDATGSDIVTQAEAEAGTSTAVKLFTAERIKQAIDALQSGISVDGTPSAGAVIVRNDDNDAWEVQEATSIGNATPRETNTVDYGAMREQYGRPTGTGTGPRTGNITITPATGAEVGSEAYMIHNDTTAPGVTGGTELSNIASDYVPGTDNMIYFIYLPDATYYQVVSQGSVPLTVLSAVIENDAPTDIVITLNAPGFFSTNGFSPSVGTISSSGGSGTNTIVLTASSAYTNGQVVTLSYDGATGDLTNQAGVEIVDINPIPGFTVQNNVAATGIVVSDDFNDASIDLSKWTITTTSNGTSFTETTILRMNAAAGNAEAFTANRITTQDSITTVGTAQWYYDYLGSGLVKNGVILMVDANNYAAIYSGSNNLNLEVVAGGSAVFTNTSTGYLKPSGGGSVSDEVRIGYTGGVFTFDVRTAGAWVNMDSYTTSAGEQLVFDGAKVAGMTTAQDASFTAQPDMDNFYLTTDHGYTTQFPT